MSSSGFGEDSIRITNTVTRPRRPTCNFGRHRPNYPSIFKWMESIPIDNSEEEAADEDTEDDSGDEKPDEDSPPKYRVPAGPPAFEVDLMKYLNKEQHHTNDFGDAIFAVRRGQKFTIKLHINRKFRPWKDRLFLTFLIGNDPNISDGTSIRIPVEKKEAENQDPNEWSAHIASNELTVTTWKSSEVDIHVKPAVDCPVGKYKIQVTYFRKRNKKQIRVVCPTDDAYILFNPWCEDDQVFLPSEEQREEYVMRQSGRIYSGSSKQIGWKPWNFAQFSKNTIRTAVLLLERNRLDTKCHGNATKVARALSAMVNSNDDNGVLIGNWSGKYNDGTPPGEWLGSEKIFSQYLQTDTSVKYGQCWVFSALITSLCRALGIPTRSVTNFASAHDTNGSLTIDTYVEKNGKVEAHDSVWNFHVWNEAWLQRPDLPDGHDGWQAFDATPQEESGNLMQCGPASLTSIKEGDVYLNYDCKFIFAEVNGSMFTWQVIDKDDIRLVRHDDTAVGKYISTKAVGTDERHDLTLDYKYPEGSEEERLVRHKAFKYSSDQKVRDLRKYMGTSVTNDVNLKWTHDIERNGDIVSDIDILNSSTDERTCSINVVTKACYYTGVTGEELANETLELKVAPGQNQKKPWILKAKEYLNEIDDDAMINIFLTIHVKETGQVFAENDRFPLPKPDLTIQISNKTPKAGEEITVTISFKNPLDLTLTNPRLTMEGPGVMKEKKIKLDKKIKPYGEFLEEVKVTPKYFGRRELLVGFNSRQLVDITGAVEISVQKA